MTNDALVLLASVVVYLHCSPPAPVSILAIPLYARDPVLLTGLDVRVVGIDAAANYPLERSASVVDSPSGLRECNPTE